MRLENNFVQVENNPVVINKVNSVAAAFGWTVQSIQVTDSSVAYSSGSVTWATEFGAFTTNNVSVNRTTYASITYQRDLEDPKYKDWSKLENEYNETLGRSFLDVNESRRLENIKKEANGKIRKIFSSILMVCVLFFFGFAFMTLIGFLMCVGQGQSVVLGICTLVFFLFGFFSLYVFRHPTKSDEMMFESMAERSLKKNVEYNRLLELDGTRREKARTEILNRARVI